jgi:hypothetical protein
MKYKKEKLIPWTLLIILLATSTHAVTIDAKYFESTKTSAIVNEPIELSFIIENLEDLEKEIIITRDINYAMGESITSKEGAEIKKHMETDVWEPYLEYILTIGPKETKEITIEAIYEIIPTSGKIELPEIQVKDSSGELTITSSEKKYLEIKCKEDNYCDLKTRENHKNCPSDCSSGEKDTYCDGKKDKKCDPDCLDSLDPDCKEGEGNQNIYSLRPYASSEKSAIQKSPNVLEKLLSWLSKIF